MLIMKKNVTMRAALLAALTLGFLTSCTKENNPENVAPSIITANIPDEITKVSLTDAGVDNGISLAWQANDNIRVIATAGGSGNELFSIKNGFTANNAQFEGTPVTGTEYTVFYPGTYADEAAINARSYTSQTQIGNGSTAHLEWNAIEAGLEQYGSVDFSGKQNGALRFKLQLPDSFTKVYKVGLKAPTPIFSTTNAGDATTDELILTLKDDASTNGITLGADKILTAYIMVSWNDNVIPANTELAIEAWSDQDVPWTKVKKVTSDFIIAGGRVTNIQLNNTNWEESLTGNYFAIVQKDVTESTSFDGGAERTWSYDDALFGAVHVLNNEGNISFRGSNRGKLYNKSEFGRITEIQVILADDTQTELLLYIGTTVQPTTNAITPVKDGNKCTYTIPDGVAASYFMLQASSATTNVSKIIVKYNVGPWIAAVTGDADDLLTTDGKTATLHGSYSAGNIPSTANIVCGFEIKGSPSGVTISTVTVSSDGSFSATASGLTPGTNYEYCAVVTYESITEKGEYKTFSTTKKTASIKTITITPSDIEGLNTSYGDYTWTQDGMELTANKILQNAGESDRFKGKKTDFQFFNTNSIGKIKSVAVLTDGYGANTLTVAGGTTSKGTDVYSASLSPVENVISVEFANPCAYFLLKSPNQNIYIKSITITVDTSTE